MPSREISVSSNPLSYRERKASKIPGNSNFVRKRNCFCVSICLIFRFAYLAYCFCAMLFSVSHSSTVNIICCLCYMPGVYLKSPMLCLHFLFVSFILQNSLDSSVSDLRFLWLNDFLWFAYLSLNAVSQIP